MISGAIISANIKRERVADMGKYEYNFVEVPFDGDLKSGNAETTCNNRLAAIRAYLWYAADSDISLQTVALTASRVPFLKVPKLTIGRSS